MRLYLAMLLYVSMWWWLHFYPVCLLLKAKISTLPNYWENLSLPVYSFMYKVQPCPFIGPCSLIRQVRLCTLHTTLRLFTVQLQRQQIFPPLLGWFTNGLNFVIVSCRPVIELFYPPINISETIQNLSGDILIESNDSCTFVSVINDFSAKWDLWAFHHIFAFRFSLVLADEVTKMFIDIF